jgi:predicted nucleic-acid-binding protein
MKLIADTNVLVRAAVRDERTQATLAAKVLEEAELIAIALPTLCEFVWVLMRVYALSAKDAAMAIRALRDTSNVVMNRPAVEAGLAMLDAGGDFTDGVIAHEGQWLGDETFVSFDKQAVTLLAAHGHSAQLLKRRV